MDFSKLLSVADSNKAKAKHEASVKMYSSVLPPPKKPPKTGVQSENIRRFLEKKKAEEVAKVVEARKQKEQLLALRSQSTKNSKKAKIMASRTKDNDFSKIKLTDDEIEAKRKREAELVRQQLANKVERMKARIEMEEREKLLPKKRKRKSKNAEVAEDNEPHKEEETADSYKTAVNGSMNGRDKSLTHKNNAVRKPSRPPPPTLSFQELLQVAAKEQHEPIKIPVKKKEEEKLMTKKEKKEMEILEQRRRRKQALLDRGIELTTCSKPSISAEQSRVTDKKHSVENCSEKGVTRKPIVVHVERNSTPKPVKDSSKFTIPKSNTETKSIPTSRPIERGNLLIQNQQRTPTISKISSVHEKSAKLSQNILKTQPKQSVQKEIIKENISSSHNTVIGKKPLQKKSSVKIAPVTPAPVMQNVPSHTIDEAAIASIEKRIREKIEKEMEAKLAAKFGLSLSNSNEKQPTEKNINHNAGEKVKRPIENKTFNAVNGKNQEKSHKREGDKTFSIRREPIPQKKLPPKPPEKRPFHKNPYLDPPRRLLEPQRPPRPPMKRRIESDDEDEEDDMSDFIDDGVSQNDEDYSKYIKEIFGYDRNRYLDDDDDDIQESSFAEQMKEETRSAKLGYLEDLEEERKLKEEEKKKKKKLRK